MSTGSTVRAAFLVEGSSKREAAFFEVGDLIVYGKWQNKSGKIVRFFDDGKGNPVIEIQPIPKGLKKNKMMPLFRIRHHVPLATRVANGFLLASRIASRYLTAVDDMQTILLKLRKGSTTPIESLKKLKKVLDHLGGWNIEPCVGVSHVEYVGRFIHAAPAEVTELHALAKKHEVKSLPVSPRVDEFYIMDLTEVIPAHGGRQGFKFELWVGAAGFEITAPNGKKFEALPRAEAWRETIRDGDFRKLPKLGPKPVTKFISRYGYLQWLKDETDFYKQVLEALGMEKHKPGAPRTRESTGSCPCCFRNIKVKGSDRSVSMVNHGYRRPGWGQQVGNCMGVRFPPFEVSPEGTRHLVSELEKQRDRVKDTLAQLQAGTLDVLVLSPGDLKSVVNRGDSRWDHAVEIYPKRAATLIRWLDEDIKKLSKLIAEWKEQPLPDAGVEAKDWQFKSR